MKAVILAGGQGSRLRPLTEKVPKPMVPVLGRPIMEHIVRHVARFGFHELLATLHYRPRAIRDHFADGSEFDVHMRYTLETEPLGTAGSVKLGADFLDAPFMVVAGDALTDFDFRAFWDHHHASGAKVSLCLKRVPDPGEFGIVITDSQGQVVRFLEKPGPSEVFSDTVNTGIYLIEPEVLDLIPDKKAFDFAGDLFPHMLELGIPIAGYVADGYWSDIGTLEQLRQAHWDMLDGRVRLPIPGQRVQEKVWLGEGVSMSPDVNLTPPVWLGDNVRVRSGVRLGPYAAICSDAEVDAHATVCRGIVMHNSFLGENCDLRNTIVGSNNVIEAQCEIGEETVIGSNCHLGRAVQVLPGVLIWPDKEIEANTTVRENLVWESLLRPSIFGSRGVTGLANLHITPEYAAALGKSYGTWVKRGRRVAVARDSHPFSRLIKRALVSGLLAVGVDVDDLEESSLPETRYIVSYGANLAGGVHVRMSDQHPSVAILELFDDEGLPLLRGQRRKIEAVFHRADFPKVSIENVGNLRYPGRVNERYFEHLLAHLDRAALEPWRGHVLHYCRETNLCRVLTEMLGLGGLTHLMGYEPRSNRVPEGTHEQVAEIARLNHIPALIVETNGEQLSAVDETGTLLRAERMTDLLTAAFIIGGPREQPVLLPPDHAAFLAEWAATHQRPVVLTRKEPAARLHEVRKGAGNDSTWLDLVHFYLGFDAVSAALRLLEYLSRQRLSLHEFERQLPVSHRHTLVLHCPWDQMGRVMREVAQMSEAQQGAVPEGVRLHFEDGWVFVLPSADVARIDVTMEAPTAAALAKLEETAQYRLGGLLT